MKAEQKASVYFEQQAIDSWVIYRGAHARRDVAGVISESGHLGDFSFCIAMIDHNGENCCEQFQSLSDAQQFAIDNA